MMQKEELNKYKMLKNDVFYAHREQAKKSYNQLRKMYGLK